MRDYEELLRSLRLCASNDSCKKCILFDERVAGDDRCNEVVMVKAADAIEELQTRVDLAVGLYNRNVEKTAMYEALIGISPEPHKEEK